MNFIYKDYQLDGDVLLKDSMQSEHLMYKSPFSGSPAIDAVHVWDKYKNQINLIVCIVHFKNGKISKFSISKEKFDSNKQPINYGTFGLQYAVPKNYWEIEEVNKHV